MYFGFYSVLKIESHSAKVVGVRFTLLYGKAISKVEYYYVAEQPLLASKRIGSSLRKKFFGRKRLQNVSNFIIASHIKLFKSSNSSLFLRRPMHISFQMNILAARQKFLMIIIVRRENWERKLNVAISKSYVVFAMTHVSLKFPPKMISTRLIFISKVLFGSK